MNLRHFHRSNTEEYKQELQELNNSAQLPYYIQKYGQKIQKSFRQLTNEYEELQKVIFRNGTHYPESTDRVGTPHPELQHLVVHKARNGKHVWSYHPELSRIHDRNLLQLMGGQKIAGRNNVTLPNRLSSLQKPTVSAVKNFAADLLNNPDRHAMSANTDPTKPSHHAEMRVRHLINALTGSEGYEIKDHPEGFEVYAPRHSKSQKADDIATRWIYNAAKKDLRSERIYPTSPNGGGYGTKFGKSIRPRPSSNLGRRQADAGKSAAQRPRSSQDPVGKNKTLVKSLKQLTKEYEILKRSKNAKQQIKNISEEERKKRLLAYAQKLGLTPVHDERDEEQELPNSYSGSQFYFNSNDELFSPEHEIGHAMLSPEGESVGAYMKRISSSPTQKDNRDEIINHALDAKIARRAGVAPRSVVPPPDLYEDAGEPIPKPLTFKTAFSPYQNEVKEIIGQFDEGKKFDSKGIKTIKDSIDRKINIRAKEAAKDVSRKDAKTLIRSQVLKKAEDEAGMTAYLLKDGYSLHHETSSNGYDIWSIGHNGQRAGSFMICTDEGRRGRPFVSWAGVDKPHRGKGIGAAVYKTLAVHYGGLDSDRNATSVDAIKAWRRAGGRQLKSKTQFGDPRYTLEGDKKRPPIVWNEDLEKAAHPNELRKLKNKTDPKAPDLVDTANHAQQTPDPNYVNFLNHPKVQRGLTNIEGISAKMVHKVGDDTFMAKPYHKKVESATKGMNPLPISGWSTMATKNLFHAAGIGHLCEDVSFHEHSGIPMTVHKFASYTDDFLSPSFKRHVLNYEIESQAKKIAVMDFLTNNLDRHAGNVMFRPSKGIYNLLAIDHERGFQYNKSLAQHRGINFAETPKPYLYKTGLSHAVLSSSFQDEDSYMPEGQTTKDWWRANKDNVLNSFNKDIESIKDPHTKNHIKMNFMERWNWMNEHSDPDRFGFFEDGPQFVRMLKERRPKTDYKAIIRNLPQAPHEAVRAIDSLFGQKLTPATKETLVDLWNEQIGKMSGQEISDYYDHIVNTSKHPHPKGAYWSLMNGLVENNNRQGMLHLVQNNKITLPYWKEKFEEALKTP